MQTWNKCNKNVKNTLKYVITITVTTQPAITHSKATTETPEQGAKHVQS